jgi:hypothetical protein
MAAVKVIKQNSPDWKITYAGGWHPELSGVLDNYCTVIGSEPGQEDIISRRTNGFTTTFYICCTPPKPNTFVFSPPVEATFLGWYAAANNYDGFLRWAYDAWPADPMRDARHVFWGAGDCFLIYPGGNSCIRFEKLREGIVDFEKIRILREISSGSTDENIKSLINNLNSHLSTFVGDRDYSKRNYNVTEMSLSVEKGRTMIREISDQIVQAAVSSK